MIAILTSTVLLPKPYSRRGTGVAAVRFGGQRQGGGGAGVFADVGDRDAFGLGAACDGGEEEGEDVVVHGVS